MKDRLKKPFYEKTVFKNQSKNSHFFLYTKIDGFHIGAKILNYTKIHILNIVIFTKFTFSKSHFSQNSHFENLIFDKIHINFHPGNFWLKSVFFSEKMNRKVKKKNPFFP